MYATRAHTVHHMNALPPSASHELVTKCRDVDPLRNYHLFESKLPCYFSRFFYRFQVKMERTVSATNAIDVVVIVVSELWQPWTSTTHIRYVHVDGEEDGSSMKCWGVRCACATGLPCVTLHPPARLSCSLQTVSEMPKRNCQSPLIAWQSRTEVQKCYEHRSLVPACAHQNQSTQQRAASKAHTERDARTRRSRRKTNTINK